MDLPVPALHTGNSRLLTNPAFRIPKEVSNVNEAQVFVHNRLSKDFHLSTKRYIPLAGDYFVSPGLTPEIVTPLAFEVNASQVEKSNVTWVALDDLLENRSMIHDVHLLTSTYRLAHAVGLIK